MATRSLHLEMMLLDPPEPGYWCPRCLVSSALLHRFALVSAKSLRMVGRRDVLACYECYWQGCGHPACACAQP